MIVQEIFTEKFRPKNLNQLIATPRIKEELQRGLTQNILFTGLPGIGKTSTMFILSQNHPTLYINASCERGIEVIRDKISKFCSSMSLLDGKDQIKCVIFDELEGATTDFHMSLKATIEKYAQTTRFIASCNAIQKIPEAIRSRFHIITFDPVDKEEELYLKTEYKKRISKLLDGIKVSYTDDTITKFIDNDFPDMRSLVQKIQSLYNRQAKELNPKEFNINFDFKDLFDVCLSKPDPINNYKFIAENYSSRIDDAFIALGKDLPNYINAYHQDKINKIPYIIIEVANFMYQKEFCIDSFVTLLATVYKIQTIIN